MLTALSPEIASQAVLWGGLLIGAALGAVAQVSRFCVMGALADRFSYGGMSRLLMWALAVVVAATGSLCLIGSGWLDATQALAWSPRLVWLSHLVGGGLFGIGMVLGSGCPQRNLVRAGAGSLKAWVTLGVVAISAQMSLRGILAELRVRWLDTMALQLDHPQDLGSVLSQWSAHGAANWPALPPDLLRWALLGLLLAGTAVMLWRHHTALDATHWAAGVLVGLLVSAAWALTGHVGFLPEHPQTLEAAWLATYSHRPEGLSFAAPIAHGLDLLTLWTDSNNRATFGVTVSLGVLLGSAAAALRRRAFRLEGFANPADLGQHLIGGLLMGFGGVTALGCSTGQGISGLSLLSAGACLAVAAMVAGAWLALRLQAWRLDRGGV